jgi:glycosyltransferase involved in cell wall biosynthesis
MKPSGATRREKKSCMEIFRFGGRESYLSQIRFIAGVLWRLVVLRRRYHCIHVFCSGSVTLLVPVLGKLLGKRTSFTMTLLGSDDPESISQKKGAKLMLRLFRLYDRVIYINPEQAGSYERIYGTKEPLISGSIGINVDAFRPPTPEERLSARMELGLEQDALIAAFTGLLIRRKGIDLAVEIWLRVAEKMPEARFVVLGHAHTPYGETDIYPLLKERIEAAGKERHFQFIFSPPSAEAVLRLLHAADVFLFPSRGEGTPSSVLEAMACGVVPVLAPLKGVTGEVLRDGIEGLVLEPQAGLETTARRVLELLDDRERLRRMSENGRERICQTHSQEVALAAMLRAWNLPPAGSTR